MKKLLFIGLAIGIISSFFVTKASASPLLFEQTVSSSNHTAVGTSTNDTFININQADLTSGTFDQVKLVLGLNYSGKYIKLHYNNAVSENELSTCVITNNSTSANDYVFDWPGAFGSGPIVHTLPTDGALKLYLELFNNLTDCNNGDNIVNSKSITVYGNNSTSGLNSQTRLNDSTGPVSGFFPYIKFGYTGSGGTGSLATLAFTSPVESQSVATGSQYIRGTCPINGSARINVSFSDFYSVPYSIDSFDLDCVGHQFIGSLVIKSGINGIAVHDKDCLGDDSTYSVRACFAPSENSVIESVRGIDTSQGWSLVSIYPPCAHAPLCDTLGPSTSDWVFRFKYTIPNGISKADVDFILNSCTSAYTGCTEIENSNLGTLDPNNHNYVDTTAGDIDVVDSTNKYYTASLEYSTSGVVYELVFTTRGFTGDGFIPPLPPGSVNCGTWQWLCLLIIPDPDKVKSITDDLQAQLAGKIPFGYYYAIKDKITTASVSNTNISVPVAFSIADKNVNIPIDISTNSVVSGFGSGLRDIAKWILYVTFIVWVYHRITERSS